MITPGAEVAYLGCFPALTVNQVSLLRQVSGPPRGQRASDDSKVVALAREPVLSPERVVAVDMALHYPVSLKPLKSV